MRNISDLLVDAVVAGAYADMLDTRHLPHVINVGCRLQSIMSTEELLITLFTIFIIASLPSSVFKQYFVLGFVAPGGGICMCVSVAVSLYLSRP